MTYKESLKRDSIKRVNNFIIKNKAKPNFVMMNNDKVLINDYIKFDFVKDGLKRINNYIGKNNRYPKYVDILGVKIYKSEYKALFGGLIYKAATPKNDNGDVVTYFKKTFGNFKTFDDALRLINNKGYAYYYDDVYSNKTCIDRIKARKGINCTDSCQLFWHIAESLNFKVTLYHVKCNKSGGGHVYLRLDKNNKTYYRDIACVLSNNGRPITDLWCKAGDDGTLLDKNPKWFMTTVNK